MIVEKYYPGGCYKVYQDYGSKHSDGGKTMEKKIIVLGGLGVSERRDRDPDRILHGGGIVYALPAHIQADKPLVVRKWKKN